MTLRDTLEDAFCVYKSTRFIRVKNKKLAIVYYSCLLLVLVYIAVYTVWYDNGYQQIDPVTGTTSVKLKGTGSVGGKVGNTTGTVYDAMDLVVPSIEENAFFVTTSMILTKNQQRDICPGNKDVPQCNISNYKTQCIEGLYSPMSQGILTGKCCSDTISTYNCTNYTQSKPDRCEVMTWCPTEDDSTKVAGHVVNIGAFTAFVKVDIAFSTWNISRSNTENRTHDGNPVDGYNLFTLDEIIGNATNGGIKNVSDDIVTYGAIILMESQWNCNLDQGSDKCNPKWVFSRIDGEKNSISQGFNYRAVNYDTNMERRLLRKLYGIRVVFTVSGQGRKFSFAVLTVTFGAGLAYLGVAAFLTDIVLEKFLPESARYEKLKNHFTDDISMRRVQVNGNQEALLSTSIDTANENAQ